jgi:hypothetical protein
MLSFPKDTLQFSWTRHIKNKMVFYHLSGAQILRIFRKPDRREEGIAPNTIAVMQRKQSLGANTPKREELWLMYKMNKPRLSSRATTRDPASRSRITMISAWRYPGTTKPGERPAIPADVLEMIEAGE